MAGASVAIGSATCVANQTCGGSWDWGVFVGISLGGWVVFSVYLVVRYRVFGWPGWTDCDVPMGSRRGALFCLVVYYLQVRVQVHSRECWHRT